MSLVHTEITLKNGGDVEKAAEGVIKDSDIRQVTVQALVDDAGRDSAQYNPFRSANGPEGDVYRRLDARD